MVKQQQSGYTLATVVVFGLVLLSLGILILQSIAALTGSVQNSINVNRAANAANAGLATAMRCINTNSTASWGGSGSASTFPLTPDKACNGTTANGGSANLSSATAPWTSNFAVSWTNQADRLTLSSLGTMSSGNSQTKNIKVDIPKTTLTVDPAPTATMTVQSIKSTVDIDSGGFHDCSLAGGNIYCWGANEWGQVGNGQTGSGVVANSPTGTLMSGVLNGKTIRKVYAGYSHTCATDTNGKVYCWGSNSAGELGIGSTADRSAVPAEVDTTGVLNGKAVTSVSADNAITCVVASGQAYCWGNNSNGQLGNGTTARSNVPVAVDTTGVLSGKTVTDINPGGSHTCAVASGQVYCWGYNAYGQLGNGTTTSSTIPVAVDTTGVLSGKTVTSVKALSNSTCVLTSDSQVYCWGYNGSGELGSGNTTNANKPQAIVTSGVLSGKTITQLDSDSYNVCVTASGKPYCWGGGNFGQLGNGVKADSTIPVVVDTTGVLSGKTVSYVTVGNLRTCAIADSKPYCWGYNLYGTLGDGATKQSNTPIAVDISSLSSGTSIYNVTPGYTIADNCLISAGKPYCWGVDDSGQLGNGPPSKNLLSPSAVDVSGIPPSDGTFTQIDGDRGLHYCGLTSSGKVYCWGANSYGQVGNGTTSTTYTPVLATGDLAGKVVTSISVGGSNSCAVAGGKVYCWGLNTGSAVINANGNGSGNYQTTPKLVNDSGVFNSKIITKVVVNDNNVCVIAEGGLYCWGYNKSGQLGNGSVNTTNTPSKVPTLIGGALGDKVVTDVAIAGTYICAVADSRAYCWGDDGNEGHLGLGYYTSGYITTPTAVNIAAPPAAMAGKTVTSISATTFTTCAIAGGNMYCWGSDYNRQRGDGVGGNSNVPIAVGGTFAGQPITQAFTTSINYTNISCGVKNNIAHCWGGNNYGELGDGTTTARTTPVPVGGVLNVNFMTRY
jgi:alpha-tubulin suppressor-like RCC1 family protein